MPKIPSYLMHDSALKKEFLVGDAINLLCPIDSTLIGNNRIICLADGSWSENYPTCKVIECEEPPIIENMNVKYERKISGSLATYTCLEGYEMRIANWTVRSVEYMCSNDRKWITLAAADAACYRNLIAVCISFKHTVFYILCFK